MYRTRAYPFYNHNIGLVRPIKLGPRTFRVLMIQILAKNVWCSQMWRAKMVSCTLSQLGIGTIHWLYGCWWQHSTGYLSFLFDTLLLPHTPAASTRKGMVFDTCRLGGNRVRAVDNILNLYICHSVWHRISWTFLSIVKQLLLRRNLYTCTLLTGLCNVRYSYPGLNRQQF